jgi:hypothetical protein
MKTHYFKNAHGMHHKVVIQKDEYEEIVMEQYKMESELEFMSEDEYDVKDPLEVMVMDESGLIHLATITSEDFMKEESSLRVVR